MSTLKVCCQDTSTGTCSRGTSSLSISSQQRSLISSELSANMRFGKTLRNSIYPEWKDQYIDYAKLKNLLRDDVHDNPVWTEDDENKFCDEVFNVQLEKVAAFQAETFKALEQRASKAAEKLQDLAPEESGVKGDITTGRFKEIEAELDAIINQTKELKNYSSMNYTGCVCYFVAW